MLAAAVFQRRAGVGPAEGGGEFALVEISHPRRYVDDGELRPGQQLCRQQHPLTGHILGDALAVHAVEVVLHAALADGETLRKLPHRVGLGQVAGDDGLDLLGDGHLRAGVIDRLPGLGLAVEQQRQQVDNAGFQLHRAHGAFCARGVKQPPGQRVRQGEPGDIRLAVGAVFLPQGCQLHAEALPQHRQTMAHRLRVDEQLDALVHPAGIDILVQGELLRQGDVSGGEKDAFAVVQHQLAPAAGAVVDDQRPLGLRRGALRHRGGPEGGVDGDQRQRHPGEQGDEPHTAAALAAGQQELRIVLALPDGNAGEEAALSDDLGGIHGVVPFLSCGAESVTFLERKCPMGGRYRDWGLL